jgi:pimeloyl-ACP methyl ester carboxylesterase
MPTLALPTHELAYETRGDGPPVLLIGGTGEPMIAWELCGLVDALVASGRQVIWYAARGVAPSGCPPLPWSVTSMAEDAAALLDHLGIDACTGIGYSLGGWTLEELVRRVPQRFVRAVLLASAGGPGPGTIREAWTRADQVFAEDQGRIPAEFTRLMTLLTSLGGPELVDPDLVADWWELLADQQDTWSGPHGEVGQAQVASSWFARDRDGAAGWPGVPVTLVHFEFDALYPPAEAATLAAAFGGATVDVVPGTGHGGMFTRSETTVAALLRAVSAG